MSFYQEPNEVGNTGLLWLFGSYGYVLFRASGLISEGSELLLLVPSLAGLVGGVVLPLLGAVPDGAIMLFSGLGDIESAQETLSVGVGALAGSTIMLLTVPWGMSVWAGRVDLVRQSDGSVEANYKGDKKLSDGQSLNHSGVKVTKETKHGAKVMLATMIPYFLIQIPASYLEGRHADNIASGEKWWALLALVVCVSGFLWYLMFHIKASREDEQKFRRMEVMKDMLVTGKLSLGGIFHDLIKKYDVDTAAVGDSQYQSIEHGSVPNPKIMEYLKSVLSVTFQKYDMDGSASLGKSEFKLFFKDFKEEVSTDEIDTLFAKYDEDDSGEISLDEFVLACYSILTTAHQAKAHKDPSIRKSRLTKEDSTVVDIAAAALEAAEEDADEEKEEVPHDIASLSPEHQEAAVKKKAFTMLAFGTLLVLLFSDPMVDVMQEIAVRVHMSPFYVSFILAPLASNASEVISSTYYASKKTTKTISVSFSALEGAAAMNNTFCLSIFMGLIYFRGLAWQYTAETIAIILVQAFIYYMTLKDNLTAMDGIKIMSVFPLSIVMIATLTALGLD
jgi:Ca2+/Na+ antiporter